MAGNRKILDDELWAHFVTFACFRRRNLLNLDYPKQILLGVLNQQLGMQQASCVGFVVMPNHVHAIVWFPKPGNLSKFMQGWKRKSSFEIRKWYRETYFHYFEDFGLGDKFWQAKYYSFEIETRSKMDEKLSYIHMNPVRAGLVNKAIEWKWSSARWYDDRRDVGVPIEWIDC